MSVAVFIQTVQVTVQLLPIVINAIKAVEDAIPGKEQGEQKLAIVRGMLEKAFVTTQEVQTTFGAVWPVIETVIEKLVTAFNKSGVFKK